MRRSPSMIVALLATSCASATTGSPSGAPRQPPSSEASAPQTTRTSSQPQRAPDAFFVDGEAVDRETYEAFKASLSEVSGTRECEETQWGGAEVWRAVDSQGNGYQIVESTEPEGDRYQIDADPPPP